LASAYSALIIKMSGSLVKDYQCISYVAIGIPIIKCPCLRAGMLSWSLISHAAKMYLSTVAGSGEYMLISSNLLTIHPLHTQEHQTTHTGVQLQVQLATT